VSSPDPEDGLAGLDDATLNALSGDDMLVVFQVSSAWFGIDPQFVRELALPQRLTPVPRAPAHILGLMPLRGRAVPILDLQRFLQLPDAEDRETSDEVLRRVIVLSYDGMTVGIVSDRVRRLVRIPPDSVLSPEGLPPGRVTDFADAEIPDPAGVLTGKGGLIIVLNVGVLLKAARLRAAGPLA
jgi:purine-binding chemotaxis protein CheW